MKCVTPMYRIYNSENPKLGKVISREKGMQLLEADHNVVRKGYIAFLADHHKYNKVQQIPCKKCWACQLNYSAEWATRIMLEAQKYQNNYWITLTYDDEHLPIAEKVTFPDGEIIENDGTWYTGTLDNQDMVTFLNSLRQYFHRKGHDGIKYYYCGEYGGPERLLPNGKYTRGKRPHYHIVLLNCPLDPTDFYSPEVDKNFKAHWKSNEIDRFWKKGITEVCELEWSDAAYTARYCTKKLHMKDKNEYYKEGKEPEYVRMSKGIAFNYLENHVDEIYKTDSIIMRTVKGNIGNIKPPKAFDRKLEQWDPEMYEKIKESRKHAAERADKLIKKLSDYTDYENLIMAAEKVKSKMDLLPRVGEW